MPFDRVQAFLTDFGNITVAGPIALLVVAWLWWGGARRLALAVGGSTFCALAAATMLRRLSRATGGELAGTPFHLTVGAPSGHATTSMVIYGAIAVLFAVGTRGALRTISVTVSVLVIIAVAITRVTLHTHSPGDVAAGLLLGALFAIPVALVARREPNSMPPLTPLLLGVVLAVWVMQWSGIRFDSTGLL
jgi:membrane-associated phospholipid phosphatase